MEIEAKDIGAYLGRAFTYQKVVDNTVIEISGISVYVARTGTGDDGVGAINLGYTDVNEEQHDFYLDDNERLTIL